MVTRTLVGTPDPDDRPAGPAASAWQLELDAHIAEHNTNAARFCAALPNPPSTTSAPYTLVRSWPA